MLKLHQKFNKEILVLKELKKTQPVLAAEKIAYLKSGIFQKISTLPKQVNERISWYQAHIPLIRFTWAAAFVVLLTITTTTASSNANPGDFLYKTKLFKEKMELGLVFSETSKVNLQAKFAEIRFNELRKLSLVPESEAPAAAQAISPMAKTFTSTAFQLDLAPATGSPTMIITQQPKPNPVVEKAKEAINKALTNLQATQGKLRADGDNNTADAMAKTITELQNELNQLNSLNPD